MGAVLGAVVDIAAKELKKNGSFKFAGVLNMKLKLKPAVPARKGVNPFTKEPCVFKAKPKSQTVRVLPLKKFKESLNCTLPIFAHLLRDSRASVHCRFPTRGGRTCRVDCCGTCTCQM